MQPVLPSAGEQVLPHEKIISMLNEAGYNFRVLILKSTLTLPYISIFVQLDRGYRCAEAETQLRDTLLTADSVSPWPPISSGWNHFEPLS
jgi:hypothetical protein